MDIGEVGERGADAARSATKENTTVKDCVCIKKLMDQATRYLAKVVTNTKKTATSMYRAKVSTCVSLGT